MAFSLDIFTNWRHTRCLRKQALLQVRQGISALRAGEHGPAGTALREATSIIARLHEELGSSKASPRISRLMPFYKKVCVHLIDAALRNDLEAAHQAEYALRPLAQMWRSARFHFARGALA